MERKNKGYVRVSTMHDSQKDSPEHQMEFIKKTASGEGIILTDDDFYEDRDTATSIVEREDVQRMIDDAKRGKISSIWFASLSRFSRDVIDAITLKRTLVNALKIRVVSIEDGYDSAKKDDELLFGIKAVINQNTSGDIGKSSRRGIEQSAEKGNYIGSIPPLGYKKVTIDDPRMKSGKRKTLEVIPDKAEIVRKIFDLYVNHGKGEKSIVNYLNGDNENGELIPSYKGGVWGLTSVQRILQNEVYTGYNVYGRHTNEVHYNDLGNMLDRRKKLVQKHKSEWKKTKYQTHEAIISKELFDAAQEMRLKRGGGERGGRREFVNAFAKMIFCAECGSAMVTMKSKSRNGTDEYRYLLCSKRRRSGDRGCRNGKWIPYYSMRDELVGEILRRLKSRLSLIDSNDINASLPINRDNDKEKKQLEKRITDNRKWLFEIRRQNMQGELDKAQYDFEREQYEKEIEAAEKRMSVISANEQRVIDLERIKKEVRVAIKRLSDMSSYDDIEKLRPLLMDSVQRIDVHADGNIDIKTYI
ncbi:serine recombinase [Paenibacillus antibioticophila]|uniref:Serine recombinase n=1 Tax=Paenibacillus antibioticophila TaxID=1274374 RepID=A0A920CJ05_9BACL|nr:recombinase family protein [Paenibacillus antibioticophila]GIO38874.1 serine recombinase [Paenibacillus antibioticophila]